MARFYSRLNYSFGNEDWKTEQQALQVKPGDRILCITASGDRPLNLLVNDCSQIVAVDANKVQNYLLSLKIAAMENLKYDEFLAFLGAEDSSEREHTLLRLIPSMPPDASRYWIQHKKMVDHGVLYQGVLEKLGRRFSRIMHLFRKEKLDRLFTFDDLEEQKTFVEKHWNTPAWKNLFRLGLNPLVSRLVIKDPGLYMAPSVHPGIYCYEKMNACLRQTLANESILLSLLFKGKVFKEAYPPCLTSQESQMIKSRLDRISIQTTDVIKFLEKSPENSFDCYSLSDIASYMTQSDFSRMMHAVYKTARPGARFSIRQFVSTHQIPKTLQDYFKRDQELEKRLEQEDRCFVYRFIVGKIDKI